jgi:hypothetical protein
MSWPEPAHGVIRRLCLELPGGSLDATGARLFYTDGDVYQFGVARGRSLGILARLFKETTWGFDTFTGMPSETPGEPTIAVWSEGHFSPGGPAANASLARSIGGSVRWVIGDYDTTLTSTLAVERGMRRARYVDVDCDLYRSAHLAVDWMFASGLIGIGTVIGYDDLWDLPCSTRGVLNTSTHHPLRMGEGKAHAEVTLRYGVRFRCICGPCKPLEPEALRLPESWRSYFVVERIGSSTPSSGFTMADSEVVAFLTQNARCRENRKRWKAFPAYPHARG